MMCVLCSTGCLQAGPAIQGTCQPRLSRLQGHWQIFFNRAVCPLFQKELSWPMRLLYATPILSYTVCFVSTPFFILVPVITVWVSNSPCRYLKQLLAGD